MVLRIILKDVRNVALSLFRFFPSTFKVKHQKKKNASKAVISITKLKCKAANTHLVVEVG